MPRRRSRFQIAHRNFLSPRRAIQFTYRDTLFPRGNFPSRHLHGLFTCRNFVSWHRDSISIHLNFLSTHRDGNFTHRNCLSRHRNFESIRRPSISPCGNFVSTHRNFISTRREISRRHRFGAKTGQKRSKSLVLTGNGLLDRVYPQMTRIRRMGRAGSPLPADGGASVLVSRPWHVKAKRRRLVSRLAPLKNRRARSDAPYRFRNLVAVDVNLLNISAGGV